MSQLDVINAQRALATRLRMWGLEVDVQKRANGFIDDLVAQGWQMAPQRETRPHPPKSSEACKVCGGRCPGACVRNRVIEGDPLPLADPTARPASEATKTAALAAMRAGFHGKEED